MSATTRSVQATLLSVLLGVLLVAPAGAVTLPPMDAVPEPPMDAPAPVETADLSSVLGDDGSFVGALDISGTVDASAWTLVSDLAAGEPPRFAPASDVTTSSAVAWSALGANAAGTDGALSSNVFALAISGSDLYVGGFFTDAAGIAQADYVARWNGSSWSALGANQAGTDGALDSSVWALAISGSDLYVGGFFTDAAGIATADYVARWNGSAWSALGSNAAGTNGALNIGVLALAVSGSDLYVGGVFTDVAGIAQADYVARYAPILSACTTPPFSDVPVSHPFCAEIKWMKDTAISTGFNDGTYRPSIAVTRQAMSAFMARLAGATLSTCTTAPFSDVPVSHPFCPEIRWMKDNAISTGFNDGTYRPSIAVTRQAMSAFMARLAGATLSTCTTAPFTDVPVSHPFCPEIKWMKDNNISTGFNDGTYRPASEVTRQAMSAFMYRVSGLLP